LGCLLIHESRSRRTRAFERPFSRFWGLSIVEAQIGGSRTRHRVRSQKREEVNIFLSSGFQPRSSARTPAQPLDQPTILNIDQGPTGQLLASIKPVRKAKSYELRYGAAGAGGTAPAAWSTLMVPNVKTAVPINGLTPGTTYAVQ